MTPPDKVKWKKVNYLLESDAGPREFFKWEYRLDLPDFLAKWDVWDYWERERVHSMRSELQLGDVLFDIGAEVGWCSVVYAKLVGPENMVLVEPTPEYWPNIKATWERNCGPPPLACFAGLMSDKATYGRAAPAWPTESSGALSERRIYSYLHTQPELPQLTIDRLAASVGNPDAITIDCEGAELVILKGAIEVLSDVRPLIWLSVHPDLALRDYGTTPEDIWQFADDMEYNYRTIAIDHEQHVFLTPR